MMKLLKIKIPYEQDAIQVLQSISHSRWAPYDKTWLLPDTRINRAILSKKISNYTIIENPNLTISNQLKHDPTEAYVNELIHWMKHKGYAENSIGAYSNALKMFLGYLKKQPAQIDHQDYVDFVVDYLQERKLSRSYQNTIVNALKLYFDQFYHKQLDIRQLARPRKEKKLPNVLSKNEVKKLLGSISNIKHRAALSLIYGCGLRRSELLNIRLNDILSNRNQLYIRQSKSNKDRTVPLPDSLVDLLREYYGFYQPQEYLFEGKRVGQKYSSESLSKVLQGALKKM